MRAGHLTAGALLLPALLGLGARSVQDPTTARDRLEAATSLRRAALGVRGQERLELRERAVAAYRAVRREHPGQRALGAEAAFRAGELLRADGLVDAARAEFQVAWDLGGGTAFRARGGLELGHLARRRGLLEEAEAAYERVLAAPDTPARLRDDAALWSGRACAELGRRAAARRLFARVARAAIDPVDRVQGHDELALSWIAVGDLDAAALELARCRAALEAVALEETPTGERVRRALERMRSDDRLRAERARRRDGLVIER